MPDKPHVVVVTGMSGAGRSTAARTLEDLGFYVVDNLPPALIEAVVHQVGMLERPRSRLAVVVDTRRGLSFSDLGEAIRALEGAGITTTLLFLDAADDVLEKRYEELRRPHPVEAPTMSESITRERHVLEGIRGAADRIIDTSERTAHDLRLAMEAAFESLLTRRDMKVAVISFGFKRGVPRVIDLLFDVRFLPNPHWVPDLRPQTGLDPPVREYVMDQPDTAEFLQRATDLLDFLLPRYRKEGKAYLTIGIGCTGGNHRSVVVAEQLASFLRDRDIEVAVQHRDAGK